MNCTNKLISLLVFVHLTLCAAQADEFYRDDAKEVVIDNQRNLMWQDDSTVSSTDKN